MRNEKTDAFAALAEASLQAGTLVNVTFHAPVSGDCLKAKGTAKQVGGTLVLQMETTLTEGRVSQKNVRPEQLSEEFEKLFDTYRKADLTDTGGTAAVMISKKGVVTLIRKGKLGEGGAAAYVSENDREKKRLLTGQEAFLVPLGISDAHGRVHDKMQSKFRQIVRFAEYIVDAEKKLRRDGELYVCDLCCGKSYLSFAAYHVLTTVCGRQVKMTCVDLKQSVMDYCAGIARDAGMDGMEFLCMNIHDFVPERAPDLVISLHACDIATDMVLEFAAKYRADAILSTPCCQHELNRELNCPTLDFIAERPILRQKFCATATDALRLLCLEAAGYRTDATELIDPEDTPKNVMLRAFRQKKYDPDSADAIEKQERYRTIYRFLYGRDPGPRL